ncbi:2OG-Fe(II) oxygenase [Lentisalinibacter orientalis]|uniref:2OG-Fe(II) oxygenase n=1 Tax=Lentisalinibacter orientalis TaxID=2992241 RepID=UPI003864B897
MPDTNDPDDTNDTDGSDSAISGDHARATARLGLEYLTGRGRPADPFRGIALIEQAAGAGDPEAAWLAATVAASGFWRARNWDVALDRLQRAAELGSAAARSSLGILAGGPHGSPSENGFDDAAALRGAIDLDAWLSPPAGTTVREAPRIRTIEGFVSPAVCDWLVERARQRLARATIYDSTTGGTTEDARRTNSQCDLDIEISGVLTFVLRARIAAATGRPDRAMEVPKVLHYAPGETFADHYDWLDPDEPAYLLELAQRGQRAETFLIYLNADFEGGETHFPEIGYSYRGGKGDAILFSNVDADGRPDPATRHAGLPPTAGEKWLFSQWIREYPA